MWLWYFFLQHLKNCCTLEDLQRPSNLLVQFGHIAVEGVVVGEGVLNRLDQEQHPTVCVHAKMNKLYKGGPWSASIFLLYRSPTLWSRRPGISQNVSCTVRLISSCIRRTFIYTIGSHSAAACYCTLTLRPARHCTTGDTPSWGKMAPLASHPPCCQIFFARAPRPDYDWAPPNNKTCVIDSRVTHMYSNNNSCCP